MPNFLSSLWSLLGVFIIALIVDLAAAYLKPKLDKFWANFSKANRDAFEQRKNKLDKRINLLLTDISELVHEEMELTRLNISVAKWCLVVLLGFIIMVQGILLGANDPQLYSNCVRHIDLAFCSQTSQGANVLFLSLVGTVVYLIGLIRLYVVTDKRGNSNRLLREYRKRKEEFNQQKKTQTNISKTSKRKKSKFSKR